LKIFLDRLLGMLAPEPGALTLLTAALELEVFLLTLLSVSKSGVRRWNAVRPTEQT